MMDSIMELINPNLDSNSAWSSHQALFAVQTGASQLLDVARTIYQEVTGDIESLCQSYAEQYDLNIKLAYNSQRMEYYFKVENHLASIDTLPAVFKHKKKVKKCIEFTSLDLMKLNERLKGTHTEILILSQKEAERMTDIVRQQISSIHQLCEAIGQLDLIMSLCLYKQSLREGTRPEFHQNTIAIKNGRHPVLDRMLPDGKCIANDVYAFSGSNFNIIQGPNMSGKSTYLKQVGLLQIMAQIGSYVPAEYFCVRICDSLFTRMSLENELEADTSAFTREMRDMSCMLQNITENSLVLIDELGRGTSTFDGVGIATALSEKLIQTQCFTFFVTHFVTLCDFLEIYPSVKVVHLHVEVTSDMDMKYSFKLADGKAGVEDYGLLTARKAGFHEDILNYAVKINEYIKEREEELLGGIEGDGDKQVMKKAMGLYFKLKQICLAGDSVDLEQVRTALIRLKQTI
jgi:DNA mismatch repair protein MSH4